MMKRLILFSVLTIFCFNLTATNMFNSMCSEVVSLGQAMDTSTFSLIDKLTNLLPFAMISGGFQKCPGQTIIVCAGLLSYILSHNESVCAQYNAFKDMILTRLGIRRSKDIQFDDTLFVFDGEDEEDAEEETDLEDELLLEASEDDDHADLFKDKKSVTNKKRKVKFL